MADNAALKAAARKGVRVRLPPSAKIVLKEILPCALVALRIRFFLYNDGLKNLKGS